MVRTAAVQKLLLVSLLVILAMLALAQTASADTLTVTNANDGGAGSLRQAILDASPGDAIGFSMPTPATITLKSGELVISKTLSIHGPGVDMLAISGDNAGRVIWSSAPLTLTNLTVRDGTGFGEYWGSGGAIWQTGAGPLTLEHVVVEHSSTVDGGGVWSASDLRMSDTIVRECISLNAGGGVWSQGWATLDACQIISNTCYGGSGMIGKAGGIFADELVMTDTLVANNYAKEMGGGIYGQQAGVGDSHVKLTRVTLRDNTAQGLWGGGLFGDYVEIVDSTVQDNVCKQQGSGVRALASAILTDTAILRNVSGANGLGGGASVEANDTLSLLNCSISGNVSQSPTTYPAGARTQGDLWLTNTQVVDNTGGGIQGAGVSLIESTVGNNDGGRMAVEARTWLSATNSTIADNDAVGLVAGGVYLRSESAHLQNCTIANNTLSSDETDSAGGVYARTGATVYMTNTIVAGNDASGGATNGSPDIDGAVTSGGGNLVGDGSGSTGLTDGVNGDQVGTAAAPIDPLVGALGDYGGDTETAPLLPGSPAIDAGSGPGSPAADQRGVTRDGSPDVGAFEARAFQIAYHSGKGQSTAIGTPFLDPIVAEVMSSVGDPVDGGAVTFAAPGSGAGAICPDGGLGEIIGGLACITPIANGTLGSFQAEAALPGLTPVTYNLENTQAVRGPGSRWIANYARGAGGWNDLDTYPRWLADVDGDGLCDVVAFGNKATYASLCTGGACSAPQEWIRMYGPAAGGWTDYDTFPRMLGDVNGDGMDDIVAFGNKATYVSLSTGSAFLAPAEWIRMYGPAAGGWNSQDTFPRVLGDVNGDGMDDIVAFGNRATYVSLSTGASFLPPGEWIGLYGPAAGGWTSYDTFPRFIDDVNGDGLDDIVAFGNRATYVSYSTGSSFGPPTEWAIGLGPAAGGWMTQDGQTRLVGDIDGDGKTDIVAFGGSATYAWKSTTQTLGLFSWFYTNDRGWTSQNLYPHDLGDPTGDGKLDIVGFGSDGVYVQAAP